MRLPVKNSLCLSATKVAFKNRLLHLALDTGIKIPRNKKSTNYFSPNLLVTLRSIRLLGIPKFVTMRASAHMRTALALTLPQRKKIEKFVLTLSGKKSKQKRDECLCQDIEFQRQLGTTILHLSCMTPRKIDLFLTMILRAQAQPICSTKSTR